MRTAELRESDARKASVLEAALDAVVAIDHTGRILEFNPAAEAILGYSRQQAQGRAVDDLLVPPALREAHLRGLGRFIQSGEGSIVGKRVETRALRADGSEIQVELAVCAASGVGSPTFTAFLRDLTDRRRGEAVLAERAQLADLTADVAVALARADDASSMLESSARSLTCQIDALSAQIWTLSEDGQTLGLRATGGRTIRLESSDTHLRVGEGTIGLIAQTGQPHLADCRAGDSLVLDHGWAPREGVSAFAGYPLIVEGRLVGVMVLFCRRCLSQATREALAAVADNIAPGISRLRAQRELATARDAAEELSRLKSEDFSKIEAGTLTIDAQPFALRETLDETLQSLALRAYSKGLELAARIAPDVPDWLLGRLYPATALSRPSSPRQRIGRKRHVHHQELEIRARPQRVEVGVGPQEIEIVEACRDGSVERLNGLRGLSPTFGGRHARAGLSSSHAEQSVKTAQVVVVRGTSPRVPPQDRDGLPE
jgi:PAS domain S-box-containing protein